MRVAVVEVTAVIPVRMGSKRLPGKPLVALSGKPMLHYVVKSAVAAFGKANCFVATCDQEIVAQAEVEGVQAVRTSSEHERASDRTAEAIDLLELQGRAIETVVMLQGDEPVIRPESLRELGDLMENDRTITIANLAGPILSQGEWENPNTIKVVRSQNHAALYFSRTPIPYFSGKSEIRMKQVCAIGFSRDALRDFSSLPATPLEVEESIDMMRWLENGRSVQLLPIVYETHAVDVVEDIAIVEALLDS